MGTSVQHFVLQSVPAEAEKPSIQWLAIRVATFLGHYWTPDTRPAEKEMMIADWCDALDGLPQQSIERAISMRLKSSDRRKPFPGEIREAALATIIRPDRKDDHVAAFAPVDHEQAKKARMISDMLSKAMRRGSRSLWDADHKVLALILAAVCETFDVNEMQICGQCRVPKFVEARDAFAFLARKHTLKSFPQIAKKLGDRDHSTIMASVARCENRLRSDHGFRALFDAAESKL